MKHLILTALTLLALASPAWAISIDAAPTVAPNYSASHTGTTATVHQPATHRVTRHAVHVAKSVPASLRHGYTTGPASGAHYRNVNGTSVHRPMHSASAPAGACAICGDGTYSFSQHHRGTCSHHGGVRTWL